LEVTQDDIKRLHDRIDHLDEKLTAKLDQVVAAQARATGVCQSCQQTLRQHQRELYGNGRAGLVADVVAQRERLDQMRDPEKTASRAGKTSIVSIIVAIGSAIAAALAAWRGG